MLNKIMAGGALVAAVTLATFSAYAEDVTYSTFKGKFNCIGDEYTSPAGVITSFDELNFTLNKKGKLKGTFDYTYDLGGTNIVGSLPFSGKLGEIKSPKEYTYTASTKTMLVTIPESGLVVNLKTKAKATGGVGVFFKTANTKITVEDQNGKIVDTCLAFHVP